MTDSRTLGQSVPKEGLFLMDGIEGLRSLPKHSVDMLLTDPPYGTTRNYWDVPLPLPELWEAVKWAVKPNGAVLFFAQCPFDKVLGASNLAMLRYEWIWYKERGTGFLNANRAPLKKSENILVFFQKSPVYNPQFTYGKPYTRVHSRSGTSSNYGKFERQGSESNDGRRYPGNVLFVPTVSGGIHPTQKPVELCEYLIRTYTRPGELVADILSRRQGAHPCGAGSKKLRRERSVIIQQYSIIYADPPWRYSAKKVQGAAENHYPTMSIEELCALPVADLAAPHSFYGPLSRSSRRRSG